MHARSAHKTLTQNGEPRISSWGTQKKNGDDYNDDDRVDDCDNTGVDIYDDDDYEVADNSGEEDDSDCNESVDDENDDDNSDDNGDTDENDGISIG